MTTEQYLLNFTSLVRWDVEKLIAVAENGEAIQLNQMRGSNPTATLTQSMNAPVPTPSANLTANQAGTSVSSPTAPTTQSVSLPSPTPTGSAGSITPQSGTGTASINAPVNAGSTSGGSTVKLVGSPFLEQHTREAAKCAIPMAVSLISAAEFIGAVLEPSAIWRDGDKFDKALNRFFNYASFPIDQTEIKVLRQSFRNGMAHSFMMQGVDVAIDYQTRFKTKDLLFLEGNQVVLNVNKLQEVVFGVLDKLPFDTSIYSNVADRVNEYENGRDATKAADFLRDLRAYWITKP